MKTMNARSLCGRAGEFSAARRSGFTLTELLVVIAIIAILAAILFPVFARARENARRSSCQSNLKQIALGIFQYTQDYDEKFPIYRTAMSPPNPYAWSDAIQPYMKSLQLYQCPSEPTPPTNDPVAAGYTDYALNLRLMYGDVTGADESAGDGGSKSLSILTQPSITVMMTDFYATNPTNAWIVGCDPRPCTAGLATWRDPNATNYALRHLDGMNFSFTDGHVKWYKSLDATHSGVVYNDRGSNGSSPTFNLIP